MALPRWILSSVSVGGAFAIAVSSPLGCSSSYGESPGGADADVDANASVPVEGGTPQADGGCVGAGCQCAKDEECGSDARHCVGGRCQECNPTRPDSCPSGRYCVAGMDDAGTPPALSACAPGCTKDEDCSVLTAAAPYCNVARHQCVACRTKADCPAALACSPAGVCVEVCTTEGAPCDNGQTCCGGLCIDLKTDVFNCNGCGVACTGASTLCCGGACVNPLTDAAHCGSCGNACSPVNSTPSCSTGNCRYACNPGFSHCATGNTGCETATSSSVTQCGSCTTNCNAMVRNAAGIACVSSACTYTGACLEGYSDCDQSRANGCEIQAACTPCPVECNGGCEGGTCVINARTGEDITCPAGMPCRVVCGSSSQCRKMIRCPAGHTCTVACIGTDACNSNDIKGEGATSVCLSCEGTNACRSVSVQNAPGATCRKACGPNSCSNIGGCNQDVTSCP